MYGILGEGCWGVPSFQLLTWGVWVQSYKFELITGKQIGGIVCFDRLHKTADHSGFVQDDRMEEMWMRLRPYARQLISGQKKATLTISTLDGQKLSTTELRELIQDCERIVAIEPTSRPDARRIERARAIARSLDALPLVVPEASVSALRVFGGRRREVLRPRVDDDAELRFYTKPRVAPPAEPWLVPPVKLEELAVETVVSELAARIDAGLESQPEPPRDIDEKLAELFAELAGESPDDKKPEPARREQLEVVLRERLGTGPVQATIYVPEHPATAAEGLLVTVLTAHRSLWSGVFASSFPGHVLHIEVPGVSPSELRGPGILGEDAGPGLAEALADLMVAKATAALGQQTERVLEGLSVGEIEPGSSAAKMALAALSRTTVGRLRAARPGRLAPGLGLSLTVSLADFDPLALPLLSTLDGEGVSLRNLSLRMDDAGGLAYGVNPEVAADLEGLDRDRILRLDPHSERLLLSIVGESAYVRVDGRDVLAEHGGTRCRDLALGLHAYPDFPLLVEGRDPTALDEAGQRACLAELLEQLCARVSGRVPPQPEDPGLVPDWEEHRRQALRHLQWYVCRRAVREPKLRDALTAMPLFLDIDGHPRSLEAVLDAMGEPEGLVVYRAHVLGQNELDALHQEPDPQAPAISGLAVSVFAYRLLLPLGKLRLAFDFDIEDAEAQLNPMTAGSAFLARVELNETELSGVVGIPRTPVAEPRILLSDHDHQPVHMMEEVAREYGAVGAIELSESFVEGREEEVWRRVTLACHTALTQLLERLPDLVNDRKDYLGAASILLEYAARHLQLARGPDGHAVVPSVNKPLAERILALPLFPTGRGTPASAQRLIERFCLDQSHGEQTDWSTVLSGGAPPVLLQWLDRNLVSTRVAHVAAWRAPSLPPTQLSSGAADNASVGHSVQHWLAVLRPDRPEGIDQTRVWVVDRVRFDDMGGGELVMGSASRLELDYQHEMFARARDGKPADLAWLLLACYAYLNAELYPVTNAHERAFQLAVAKALGAGKLQMLSSPG